jgi:hypothetical protein
VQLLSSDPNEQPRIDPNYLASAEDRQGKLKIIIITKQKKQKTNRGERSKGEAKI